MTFIRPAIAVLAGLIAVVALVYLQYDRTGAEMANRLEAKARVAIAAAGGKGVAASFHTSAGSPTRHPVLSGGKGLNEKVRARVARAVAAIPGAGGVRWSDGTIMAQRGTDTPRPPMHCQDDVDALLRSRTIRFEESSANLDPASRELIGEVARALRPCLGAIIAITGHTDSSGPEPGNIELSQARAKAVEAALVARGIPADGLRASGVGSARPVSGLDPRDPANRRIEFSVIAIQPVVPTPVDTPGPR